MKLKLSNLTAADWVGLLTPTVTIALAAITVWISGEGSVRWTALAGLAITFLTVERVARLNFEHEVRSSFVQQKRADLDLICLGSVADGVRWFSDHLEGLERVENTVFTRGENSHIIDQATWTRHLKNIRSALSANCIWTDLALTNQVTELEQFRDGLPGSDRKRYNLFSLNVSVPMMQCMTLRYRDGGSKVLFGWDFASPTCTSNFVFLGEGEKVIGYFGQYMAGVQQVATRVSPPAVPSPQQPPQPPPPPA